MRESHRSEGVPNTLLGGHAKDIIFHMKKENLCNKSFGKFMNRRAFS
jgi:hypothetical protein